MARKKKLTKKPWAISHGHLPHMSGAGVHDSRPRGQRDRSGTKQAQIRLSLDAG